MAHIIRLHSQWQSTSHADRTHHARNFGRPRITDAHERVWLVCQHIPGSYEATLNGQALGAGDAAGTFAVDVTELLLHRNTVVFAVASADPLGEVALEIRTMG